MSDNYNIICDKQNIILKKNKENKNFLLELTLVNNNIDIKKIINFKIYELMSELNKDIIEKILIEDTELEDKKKYCSFLNIFVKNLEFQKNICF